MFGVVVGEALVVVESGELGHGGSSAVGAVGEEGRGLGGVEIAGERIRALELQIATETFADFEEAGVIPGVAVARLEFDGGPVRIAAGSSGREE